MIECLAPDVISDLELVGGLCHLARPEVPGSGVASVTAPALIAALLLTE